MPRMSASAAAAGVPGRRSRRSGGGMLEAWRSTASAVEPVRGGVPLSAWKAIAASA